MTCKEIIKEKLGLLPSMWKDKIACVICDSINIDIKCEDVKDCESLTSLSQFVVDGTNICITYVDEKEESFERCFDFADIVSLKGLDPQCLAEQDDWDEMHYSEQMQTIIDKLCTSCNETTTTSTSTTSSTTNTTTLAPNLPVAFWGYFNSNPLFQLSTMVDNLSYQFEAPVPTSAPFTLNFTSAANERYIVVKVPDTVGIKTEWENTPLNSGYNTPPGDQVMNGYFVRNGFTYYVSRLPFQFDGTAYTLTLKN